MKIFKIFKITFVFRNPHFWGKRANASSTGKLNTLLTL